MRRTAPASPTSSMGYFYDTQAWIPKNVTIVNRAAFGQLDKSTQETMLKVAAAAEARAGGDRRTRPSGTRSNLPPTA